MGSKEGGMAQSTSLWPALLIFVLLCGDALSTPQSFKDLNQELSPIAGEANIFSPGAIEGLHVSHAATEHEKALSGAANRLKGMKPAWGQTLGFEPPENQGKK